LTDEQGRAVAKWLLQRIANSYRSQYQYNKGWSNINWVSLVVLGYLVGWAKGGVGTLLWNLRFKDRPLTLANARLEAKTARVIRPAKDPKRYVLAMRIAQDFLGTKVSMKPKTKPTKAGAGLFVGIAAALIAVGLAYLNKGK
jgi:hypothetical protein